MAKVNCSLIKSGSIESSYMPSEKPTVEELKCN